MPRLPSSSSRALMLFSSSNITFSSSFMLYSLCIILSYSLYIMLSLSCCLLSSLNRLSKESASMSYRCYYSRLCCLLYWRFSPNLGLDCGLASSGTSFKITVLESSGKVGRSLNLEPYLGYPSSFERGEDGSFKLNVKMKVEPLDC